MGSIREKIRGSIREKIRGSIRYPFGVVSGTPSGYRGTSFGKSSTKGYEELLVFFGIREASVKASESLVRRDTRSFSPYPYTPKRYYPFGEKLFGVPGIGVQGQYPVKDSGYKGIGVVSSTRKSFGRSFGKSSTKGYEELLVFFRDTRSFGKSFGKSSTKGYEELLPVPLYPEKILPLRGEAFRGTGYRGIGVVSGKRFGVQGYRGSLQYPEELLPEGTPSEKIRGSIRNPLR